MQKLFTIVHSCFSSFLHTLVCLGFGVSKAIACSQDLVIIIAIVGPAKWVGPSMELGLANFVALVSFSVDDDLFDLTHVRLGWSLRLLILEQSLGGDSSLLDTISSHLDKNEIIIIATVGPAKWVGPSVELGLANQVVIVGLSSKGGMVIELTKIGGLLPLNVFVISWNIILKLGSESLLTPVLGHPRVNWLWLASSSIELNVEVWVHVLDLGVGVPGLALIVLGLSGGHVWLASKWVWHGVWILIEVEVLHVDWEAVWGRGSNGGGRRDEKCDCKFHYR